jgi:hypothetical protein
MQQCLEASAIDSGASSEFDQTADHQDVFETFNAVMQPFLEVKGIDSRTALDLET